MKRTLVIGEHSYIGQSFRDYIQHTAADMQVDLIGARDDAWKQAELGRYDAILHLAAIVHTKEQPSMRREYREVNTVFPVRLAALAKKAGVSHFLFLSTMAVYGAQPSPIGPDTPLAPVSMYARSKWEAERRLQKLSGDGFCVSVFRPPMVYGPGCPGNYGRLARLAGHLPCFPQVENKRSMIYIENLCACIQEEIEQPKEAFRILCPQNAAYVNTTKLVQAIRRAHGKRTWILPFGQTPIRIAAAKNETLQKVFGDCYYAKEKQKNTYQEVGFWESIQRTEGYEKAKGFAGQ